MRVRILGGKLSTDSGNGWERIGCLPFLASAGSLGWRVGCSPQIQSWPACPIISAHRCSSVVSPRFSRSRITHAYTNGLVSPFAYSRPSFADGPDGIGAADASQQRDLIQSNPLTKSVGGIHLKNENAKSPGHKAAERDLGKNLCAFVPLRPCVVFLRVFRAFAVSK